MNHVEQEEIVDDHVPQGERIIQQTIEEVIEVSVEGGPNACSVECRKNDLPRRWHSS